MKKVIMILVVLFSITLFANKKCDSNYLNEYNICVDRTNQRFKRCDYYRTMRNYCHCRNQEMINFIDCIKDAHVNYTQCMKKR